MVATDDYVTELHQSFRINCGPRPDVTLLRGDFISRNRLSSVTVPGRVIQFDADNSADRRVSG